MPGGSKATQSVFQFVTFWTAGVGLSFSCLRTRTLRALICLNFYGQPKSMGRQLRRRRRISVKTMTRCGRQFALSTSTKHIPMLPADDAYMTGDVAIVVVCVLSKYRSSADITAPR